MDEWIDGWMFANSEHSECSASALAGDLVPRDLLALLHWEP